MVKKRWNHSKKDVCFECLYFFKAYDHFCLVNYIKHIHLKHLICTSEHFCKWIVIHVFVNCYCKPIFTFNSFFPSRSSGLYFWQKMFQYINYNQFIISYCCNFTMINVRIENPVSLRKSLSKVFFLPYCSTFKSAFVKYLQFFYIHWRC